MNTITLLIDFAGSLEPSTWISSRGVKAGPFIALLFIGYIFLRDGIRRGAFSLLGYATVALTLISTL